MKTGADMDIKFDWCEVESEFDQVKDVFIFTIKGNGYFKFLMLKREFDTCTSPEFKMKFSRAFVNQCAKFCNDGDLIKEILNNAKKKNEKK